LCGRGDRELGRGTAQRCLDQNGILTYSHDTHPVLCGCSAMSERVVDRRIARRRRQCDACLLLTRRLIPVLDGDYPHTDVCFRREEGCK
jgi:hypothetical protein